MSEYELLDVGRPVNDTTIVIAVLCRWWLVFYFVGLGAR